VTPTEEVPPVVQSPSEVLELIRVRGVKAVDLRFLNTTGRWQHLTIPSEMLDESAFAEGINCQSSFPGWAAIKDYDLRLIPVVETAFIDPFCKHPTLVMLCELFDPLVQETYSRDPRHIARRAAETSPQHHGPEEASLE
jgi:glutamine synthetase